MDKKDRQHYVSQSYLRNFSPDLSEYLKIKDKLDGRQRRKFKSRMKIHYYDIEEYSFGYGRISSLARVNLFLAPAVDEVVRKTEASLALLREVIENKSESFLYENDVENRLREIANCLIARSIVFGEYANLFCSMSRGDLVRADGVKFAEISYTDEAAELFQTLQITNDMKIVLPLMLKSIRFRDPSANIDGTFHELLEERNVSKEELLDTLKSWAKEPLHSIIPDTMFPVLIYNESDMQFITGDVCAPKTDYVLPDLKTRVPFHHFPINPELAIAFLEHNDQVEQFPTTVNDRWEIWKRNRLVYNCSANYIFSRSREPLELVTRIPKDLESTVKALKRW